MTDLLGPYALGMVHHADCLDAMRQLPDGCVDAVVTDPPYGLGFMGKDWDAPGGCGDFPMRRTVEANTVNTGVSRQGGRQRSCVDFARRQQRDAASYGERMREWSIESIRVAKPGAHLLAFGGTRTFHRLACAIEDAGWEIRDCIGFAWVYGQGFPKSLDVSKAIDRESGTPPSGFAPNPAERSGNGPTATTSTGWAKPNRPPKPIPGSDAAREWSGWGTALKPAWEPIILARKPLDGTVARNVQAHGTGAINVDGCRIGTSGEVLRAPQSNPANRRGVVGIAMQATGDKDRNIAAQSASIERTNTLGRWPANLVLDEEAAAMLDEQSGEKSSGLMRAGQQRSQGGGYNGGFPGCATDHDTPADSGGASRFFYCAKATREERDRGCEQVVPVSGAAAVDRTEGSAGTKSPRAGAGRSAMLVHNNHPTVKPLNLMRWLCRLVAPPDGIVLDPFSGSGTTGCAAKLEGLRFVGFDSDAHYCEIANARIAATGERLGDVRADTAKIDQQIGLLRWDERQGDGDGGQLRPEGDSKAAGEL